MTPRIDIRLRWSGGGDHEVKRTMHPYELPAKTAGEERIGAGVLRCNPPHVAIGKPYGRPAGVLPPDGVVNESCRNQLNVAPSPSKQHQFAQLPHVTRAQPQSLRAVVMPVRSLP